MLLLPADMLPAGPIWTYELKLDGFRAIWINTDGDVRLRSRNDKDFYRKYPAIARALAAMPDETMVDGEGAANWTAIEPSAFQRRSVGSRACPHPSSITTNSCILGVSRPRTEMRRFALAIDGVHGNGQSSEAQLQSKLNLPRGRGSVRLSAVPAFVEAP
jgi:hypothetical protein